MNEIEKKILEDELEFDGEIVLTYRIEYPEIKEIECFYGISTFNRYNQNSAMKLERYIVTDLYREAVELYKYNKKNGYPIMKYEIIQEYTVTYNKDDIISLYYDTYEFRGGAHGNTIRESQTWNLNLGKKIPLYKFCLNNPYYILNILRQIIEQIRKQIESGTNYYFDNYGELVIDTFNPKSFYLTDKGTTVYFQQYDIAPYSSGIPEFYIKKNI